MVSHRAMKQQAESAVESQNISKYGAINTTKDNGVIKLQRRLGIVSGTAIIVGSMIGSGIFISPKGVLEGTGSVGLSLIVWAIGGILAIMGALSYVELGTAIPKAGGEYTYLAECFGPLRKDIGPVPAFLFSWLSTLILRPSGLAVMCLTLADNALQPFFSPCVAPLWASKCIAVAVIGLLAFVNCYSVKAATSLQNVFTATKLLAIGIIIVGGLIKLCQGNIHYLATGFEGTSASAGSIVIAFYNAMWAYDGWNNINLVTEEIINPSRNLPLSLFIGVPLVMACYLLTNVAYLTVMSTTELLASNAVAVTFGENVLGPISWCIPLFIVFSTFGSANSSCFCGARLCFAAARQGHLAQMLSYVHIEYYTPSPALIFNAIMAMVMIIPSDIGGLINCAGFTTWIVYGMVMVSVLVLRRTQPHLPRPFKVPLIIPVVMILVSAFLVITPLVDDPRIEYVYVIIFIFAGLAFYIPFVYYKVHLAIMNSITCFCQLMLSVVPPTKEDID